MEGEKILGHDSEHSVLFLSYHGTDRETVSGVSRLLESRGISTFLDRKDLAPGLPWPDALERVLAGARAVAVFLGGKGLGTWQKREMWFALDRQAKAEAAGASFPVIPILLPGADPTAGFLFLNTWIDLRSDPADATALDRLARAVQEEIEPQAGEVISALCPYRGLEPFGEEDAAFFCGREAFSDRLLKAVLANPFVAVVGPSGSGKSSVVRAGLLPRLRRQRPPATAWDSILFTPGERPWHRLGAALLPLLEPAMSEVDRLIEATKLGDALASGSMQPEDALHRALQKSHGTGRLLVVADQFEELFTLTHEAARRPFVESLVATTGKVPVTLALTLRADFYDRALTVSRFLSDWLEGSVVNLGPLHRDELERAIRDPAERVGLAFETGLVDRILAGVGEEPGNLPLLEFALTELWARRSKGRLTNGAYTEIGGVAGAIAQRAETEFARLTPKQRAAARRVFTDLVRVARPEDGGRDTRRRARLASFDDAAREVVNRLAGHETRMLVTGRNESGESVVEIAHEALIQSWYQLRHWLREDRELLVWRERLRAHLADHQRNETLLTGASLVEAERWLGERRRDLSPDETALIEASTKARHAQDRRRRRLALAGVGIATLIAFLGAVAAWLGVQARQQANEARVASILATQEAIRDPAVVALLAMEVDKMRAPRMKASLDAVRFALRAAESALPTAILRGHMERINSVAFSPDGSRIVTASHDGTARIFRTDGSGEPIVLRGHEDRVWEAVFSPDGRRIVTASEDATARVWNADGSGKPVVLRGHKFSVGSAAFSPDGSRIVTASSDSTARIWRADGYGEPIVLRGHAWAVQTAVFNRDGSRVVTASDDGIAGIWNADGSGKPVALRGHKSSISTASFSPDGSQVVTASSDSTARIWNVDGSGKPVVLIGHQDSVVDAAFSLDGSRIVTASEDGTARIWNADGSGNPVVLTGHQTSVNSAAFSPDGRRVVTASEDGTARVWTADDSGEPVILRGHEERVRSAIFSSDGSHVVTASSDRTARVWEAKGSGEPLSLSGTGLVTSTAFNPSGSHVVAASRDSTARVWSSDGSGEPVVYHGHSDEVVDAAFSPDSTRVVTASYDLTAHVWNADGSGEPVVLYGHEGYVLSAAFSPDGTRVVTTSTDRTARVWNADGSDMVVLRGHKREVRGATFSPDGLRVVTASQDSTARVWNADGSGKSVVLRGHQKPVASAVFSPDGRRIVTASEDATARVWTVDGSGEPVVLRAQEGQLYNATFSPDGSRVLTDTARVWNADGSGEPVVLLRGGESRSRDAVFSPDGSRVLTIATDGTAQVWNADGSGEPVVLRSPEGSVVSAAFSPDGSRVVVASASTVLVWRIGWGGLLKYLRRSIHACLTRTERIRYLGEAGSEAQAVSEACQHNAQRSYRRLAEYPGDGENRPRAALRQHQVAPRERPRNWICWRNPVKGTWAGTTAGC